MAYASRAEFNAWRRENRKDPAVRAKHNEDRALRHLMARYGVSADVYRAMHTAQNGLCANCGRSESLVDKRTGKVRRLSVDHDHTTGKIRGLLCNDCNTGLGKLGDTVEGIKRLLAYLEKP